MTHRTANLPEVGGDHNRILTGRLLVLASAILWSTSAVFVKAPIFSNDWPVEYRGLLMGFWRAVFASLVLVVMVRKVTFSWTMLLMACFFVVMNWSFLTAMVEIESAATIWLQYTAPAWVFLGSWLLFRERVTRDDWMLLGCVSIGVAIILCSELSGSGASLTGITLALVSGITYAGVVLCLRKLRDHDSAWLIFFNHLMTALVFLPFVIMHSALPHGNEWFYLAAFGAFQMGLPYLLFAHGVKYIPGHRASMIVLIEPVILPMWVWLFWRNTPDYQPPSLMTLAGGVFILAGLSARFLFHFGHKNHAAASDESESSQE